MEFVIDESFVIKLLVALVIGGLIGAEREYRDKAAGFRTLIFICIGSTLFTMLSQELAHNSDPARIAAQIVTGVGFLGGGAILRHEERIVGLTTAAAIWLTAALGMAVGAGHYGLAVAATAVILVVLWIFPSLENLIDRANHSEIYQITTANDEALFQELRELFIASGLRIISSKRAKTSTGMVSSWSVYGSVAGHVRLVTQLLAREDVLAFRS